MAESAPHSASEVMNMLAMCFDAGITADEMSFHPQLGMMLNLSGVEKLAKLAPDQSRARDLVNTLKLHFAPTGTAVN